MDSTPDESDMVKDVPIINLATTSEEEVVRQVAFACNEFGFFQIINHGISSELIDRYLECCQEYFALPLETKLQWKRSAGNARGFFNDELTQQKRDWKEALDVGVPGSRDWSIEDDSPENKCLDGWNQLPSEDVLPNFRTTISKYFDELSVLADRIAVIMAKGLGQTENSQIIKGLRESHSSYLRANYYPLCDEQAPDGSTPLGISPHRDAGFLTILLQDIDCHSLQVLKNDNWVTIHPADKYAFTINTGDMAEVWSNGKYKAPLHRVLSNEKKLRYSTPFFYNPKYDELVQPLQNEGSDSPLKFDNVLWGYFRAIRFAGDLTDLGVEIQVSHFRKDVDNAHKRKQEVFAKEVDFKVPFNVEKFTPLLLQP